MSVTPLLIGIFMLLVTGRALVIGGASADGQGFRREEEPALYWSIVSVGFLGACFLLYLGFSGRG